MKNLTNKHHKTLLGEISTKFSEAENYSRNLHFLLLTETDGNGQLNISMQQLATSLDSFWKFS